MLLQQGPGALVPVQHPDLPLGQAVGDVVVVHRHHLAQLAAASRGDVGDGGTL